MFQIDPNQAPAPIDDASTQAPASGPGAPASAQNGVPSQLRQMMMARMLMGGSVNPGMLLGLALSQGAQNGAPGGKGGGTQAPAPVIGPAQPPMVGNFPPSNQG